MGKISLLVTKEIPTQKSLTRGNNIAKPRREGVWVFQKEKNKTSTRGRHVLKNAIKGEKRSILGEGSKLKKTYWGGKETNFLSSGKWCPCYVAAEEWENL